MSLRRAPRTLLGSGCVVLLAWDWSPQAGPQASPTPHTRGGQPAASRLFVSRSGLPHPSSAHFQSSRPRCPTRSV